MTTADPIITAARDHAEARRDVLADIAASLPPDQLASAALDLVVLTREDLARVTAALEASSALNAKIHDALETATADAEARLATARDLSYKLHRIAAAAGVGDGSAEEVTGRIVAAIADLRERSAKPAATVEPMTEADRQRRLRAEQNRASAPADQTATLRSEIADLRGALDVTRQERDKWLATAKDRRADLMRVAAAVNVERGGGDDVAGRIAEEIGKLSEERDVARADVVRLTAERNSDRMAAHEEKRRCTAAVSEARVRIEDLQRAIARIVTCPPEEEHAAMADARLLVGEAAIARYAGAPTKPEPQPVATVELTPTLRYKPVAVREVPPGTPAVWLGLGDSSDHVAATMNASGPGRFVWSTKPPPWAFGAIIDTTPGAPGGPVDVDAADLARVYAVGWTDAQRAAPCLDVRTYDPASWAAVIRYLAEQHPDVPAGRLRVVVRAAAKDGGQ